MGPPAPKPARRRNRKRKRRAVSSGSSSSDDDSSSDESIPQIPAPLPTKEPESDATSSSESSSSDSSSESDDDDAGTSRVKEQIDNLKVPHEKHAPRPRSPSPPPPSAEIPSFLPSNPSADDVAREQAMKDKFRKFWMSSLAEGFKEDLEEIRKEPNLGSSRLALLIDSLAAGADVFTSSASANGTDMNEMDVVMGE